MWRLLLTFFLLALVTRAEDTEVLVLTNDNFDAAIKDNEYILVEFYAPWCGHCKALAPEYDAASLKLKEQGSKIKLGKVDATVESTLASKYSVQGYPTLKFFKSGSPTEYNGGRKADDIIAWVLKKSGPPLVEVKSKDDIEKAKKEHQVIGVLVSSDKNSELYKVVEKVANTNDALPFLYTDDVKNTDGLKENSFTLFKQFDEPMTEFKGKATVEELSSFISREKIALVTEFSQETSQAIFESETKVHLLAFSTKGNEEEFKKHKELLTGIAKKFIGKLHILILDLDNGDSMRVAEYFSIKKESVPSYVVLNLDKNMLKFFPEKQIFESAEIEKFAQSVLDNKVKPFLKSQDEPEDWDKQPVKVLVANKFEEHAVIKDKAVFVEFYAPWCGHCKALTPIWEQLAEKFQDDKDIIIAKMDSTENELETITVSSFPTLKYSPKGSTEFIDYKGGRTLEALEKFVKSDGVSEESGDEESHDEL